MMTWTQFSAWYAGHHPDADTATIDETLRAWDAYQRGANDFQAVAERRIKDIL